MQYLETPNFLEKLKLVFSQLQEHRLASSRLTSLVLYYLKGDIDFRYLIFIGDIVLFFLAIIVFKAFKPKENKALYFLPVMFLLFQHQYWEISLWALGSLSYFYHLFFVFSCIYVLTDAQKESYKFLLAIVLAISAAFSFGNGVLIFPIGFGILLFQKRYKEIALWLLTTVIVYFFYFYGYVPGSSSLKSNLSNPFRIADYFFSFLGSPFYFYDKIGALSLLFFIFLTFKKYYEKNLAIYSFLVFLFCSALIAALTRSGLGIEQSLTSRYKIFSILIFIFFYLAVAETCGKERFKKIFPVLLIFAIIFNLSTHFEKFRGFYSLRNALESILLDWNRNSKSGAPSIYSFQEREHIYSTLNESVKKGIYNFDINAILPPFEKQIELPAESKDIVFEIENVNADFSPVIISGFAYLKEANSGDSKTFLILRSPERTYAFKVFPQKRTDIAEAFKNPNFIDSGFLAFVPAERFEKGDYTLGLYVANGGMKGVSYSGNLHIVKDDFTVSAYQ